MKKTAIVLAVMLVLSISLLAGVESVKIVRANFVPSSTIHMISPTNTTYNSNTVILNCSVVFVMTQNKTVTFSLDGGANVTIINKQGLEPYVASEELPGDTVLTDLADGSHHLELYSENFIPGYAEVYFSIETIAPTPTIYPTPTPIVDPYPIWLLSISYATIGVVVVGLLFIVNKYFRGKKH